jgi:hypothetical protein
MAGNLAMVHRVLIGMGFEKDGIKFSPKIPKVYGGKKSLTNFKYRKAILDISVEGFGKNIASIQLDGKALPNAFLPGSLTGKHAITIKMDNKSFDKDDFKITPNHYSLPAPVVTKENNSIAWNPLKSAKHYKVYRNGIYLENTYATQFAVDTATTSDYKVSAVDSLGWESFTSEPLMIARNQDIKTVEIEDFIKPANYTHTGYTGKGFVEFTQTINPQVEIPVSVDKDGTYLINFKYSNGSGRWSHENRCAIRSLYLNGKYIGVSVFPQRGQDEWSNWGASNDHTVKLNKGINKVRLTFEEWNNNMNVDINRMMLDNMKVTYVGN